MGAEHQLEKVIAAYGEAWNSHDIEAIVSMHTDDSVFENHTSGGKGVGKDAIYSINQGLRHCAADGQEDLLEWRRCDSVRRESGRTQGRLR